MSTPTIGISKFLNHLIRPLFDKYVRATTIINGVDLIRRLDTYIENNCLKPTTPLCTFDITDLYTMLPQEESLDILTEFLLQHGYNKVKGVPIQTNQKDINIKINYTVNTSVDFLDVTIMNENSELRTSIYHKPAAEPYILPYTSDHPPHIHRNVPYAALLRAARICSNVHDFNSERIRIDVSLLLNNYPPNFISKQFNRFFLLNHAIPVLTQLDKQVYYRLHRTALHQPTRREKQLNSMMNDSIVSPTVLQPKIWNHKLLYPRYMFDSGQSTGFPKEFYNWSKTYYGASPILPAHNVQIRLVADTNRTLEGFVIHKKPLRYILTKLETT